MYFLNFYFNYFIHESPPKDAQNGPYWYELDFPVDYWPHKDHVMQCTGQWFEKKKGIYKGAIKLNEITDSMILK